MIYGTGWVSGWVIKENDLSPSTFADIVFDGVCMYLAGLQLCYQ